MKPILVFGRNGQVARSLFAYRGEADFRFFGREDIRPWSLEAIASLIEQERPCLVLNAAAYTQVDLAEKEPEAAYRLNADIPKEIAITCSRMKIPFVHISSDYVFDGTKSLAYVEEDRPNPLGVYGASKLKGDEAILTLADVPFTILRTSWVFSHVGETFPRKILRRALEQGNLRVVSDQRGCPTPSDDLALTMIEMGKRLLDSDGAAQGLFNYCGDSAMSWFEFATKLVHAAQSHGLRTCAIDPILTSELNLPAKRPLNSVLDCSAIAARCSIRQAPLQAAIERSAEHIMKEMLGSS